MLAGVEVIEQDIVMGLVELADLLQLVFDLLISTLTSKMISFLGC